MATYGKKKRPIFPGFAVFQDNEQSSKQPPGRAAYTQLSVERSTVQPDIHHNNIDDSEVDELANIGLLNPRDHQSGVASTRNDSLQSGQASQASAKPLPPLPLKPRQNENTKKEITRPVLGPKSTNLKMGVKARIPVKPQISPPILISTSTDPLAERNSTGWTPPPEEAYQNRKIFALQQQAEAQEAETKRREARLAAIEASFKHSPLQRGKLALTTAKRAIISRLGSPKIRLGKTKKVLNRTLSGPEYGSTEIQPNTASTTHRPLPVYESMRTRRETPEPQEERDPFSDAMEMNEAWSDFEVNLNHCKDDRDSLRQHPSSRGGPADIGRSMASEKSFAPSKTSIDFSNKVSGLRQHPDPEFFSSSPVGFSTPRVRLEPLHDANGKKRLSTVLIRDPSVPNSSIEQDTTDDEADPLIRGTYKRTETNMKRKSATENLRFKAAKRAKTDSATSGELSMLARGFDQLDTNDHEAMEGIGMTTEGGPSNNEESENKAFAIFDMGKGKGPKTKINNPIEDSTVRKHSRQHSSSQQRPTSVLFSRESRARVPLLGSYRDDEMDIDELQAERM
ncbi:MAG: hypothetical protein Q9170_000329 [Blastenia crenularia]